MFILKRIIFLIFFFINRLPVHAQLQNSYSFNRYDAEDGLINEYNAFFFADSRGFLWISSTNGLNRFDGQRVKKYVHIQNDSTSLVDNNIQSPFLEDNNGDIWFCTAQAIHCYKRSKDAFERYWIEKDGKKVQYNYYSFYLDKEGYLWLRLGSWGNNPVLYKFNTRKNSQGKNDYFQVSNFNGFRSQVYNLGQNNLLYSYPSLSGYGFVEYDFNPLSKTPRSYEYFTDTDKDIFKKKLKIRAVSFDNEENIWLATDIGLVLMNRKNKSYRIFDTFKGVVLKNTLAMVSWRGNSLILTTEKEGVFFFDKTKKEFYHNFRQDNASNNSNGLCSNKFNSVYIDSLENLWLSSWDNSCMSHMNLKKIKFASLEISEKFKNNKFSRVIEDKANNIWVSCLEGDVAVYDKNKKIIKTYDASLFPEKRIRKLITDESGRIWLFTDHQLFNFDKSKDKFQTIIAAKDFQINDIIQLKDKRLLFTTSRGLYEIKESNSEFYVEKFKQITPQYVDASMSKIFQDAHQNIYVDYNNAGIHVFRVNKKALEYWQDINLVEEVYKIYEKNDTLWIGGNKGLWKIFLMADNKYHTELVQNINFIFDIEEDKKGQLWLATDNSFYRYNPLTNQIKKFTASDGIKAKFLSNIMQTSASEMWLLGLNNINVFRPEEIVDYDNPPIVQVTGIKVNDSAYTKQGEVSEIKNMTLAYEDNTIDLEFVAIEFGDSPSNRVKFRLDNLDAEGKWFEMPNIKPRFTYYKLPPGTYTFRIKGFNSDGIESRADKTLTIRILPPWYLTWWAIILWVLIALGLIYAFVQWRLYVLKKREEFKQKILQTEMKALRAQMDPHFLFNTMNSINAFILKNDRMKASRFLTDFSHLIRKILDFSKEETISLEKEEEILRGYLEMEAMRFDNNFDYDITIDDALDPWDTQVPTMILQPFIENAILHGIRHKTEGRGNIQIRFIPDGTEFFKCILEDNGIGRVKAAEINKNVRQKSHVSKGTSITNDRIDILNHQRDKKTELLLEDLYTPEKQACGTRVTIRIPFF